jgi:hypothetical protein
MDKMGVAVIFICIFVAEAGVAYIWTDITIETTKQSIQVDLSNITIKNGSGMLIFKISENTSIGPIVHIGLWNGTGRLLYATTWKLNVSNSTEWDHQLLQNMTPWKNYTVWYIDYENFTENTEHVLPRADVLISVDETT